MDFNSFIIVSNLLKILKLDILDLIDADFCPNFRTSSILLFKNNLVSVIFFFESLNQHSNVERYTQDNKSLLV